jgi:hypothetical protein
VFLHESVLVGSDCDYINCGYPQQWLHADLPGFEKVWTGKLISAIRCGLMRRNDRVDDEVTLYQTVASLNPRDGERGKKWNLER